MDMTEETKAEVRSSKAQGRPKLEGRSWKAVTSRSWFSVPAQKFAVVVRFGVLGGSQCECLSRIFHARIAPLSSTAASARCGAARRTVELFPKFATTGQKPLKRLRGRPPLLHRAEATVLMRKSDVAYETSGPSRTKEGEPLLPFRPSAFGFRPSFGLRPSAFELPTPPDHAILSI